MSRHSSLEPILNSLRAELVVLRERMTTVSGELALLLDEKEAWLAEKAALEVRIAELEGARKNSSNSSKPPSSDHPHDPKSQREQRPGDPTPSGRKRGGQPGHPGTTRDLLPVDKVQAIVTCVPDHCGHCRATFLAGRTVPVGDPIREQVWELPPLDWEITEYQRHCCICPDCGHRTWGIRPPEAPQGCLGFRAEAAVGLLTGGAQLPRRPAQTLLRELLGLPLALGTLSSVEETLKNALGDAYAEVAARVKAAPVVYCDETPWRAPGAKPWLWAAATAEAALFRIAPHRDLVAFEALGLDRPDQIKVSDRYTVYINGLPVEVHALCWAHLDRDFAAWERRSGVARVIARWLSEQTDRLFGHWHAFRVGACDRSGLAKQMRPVQSAVRAALQWGVASGEPQFQRFCQNLLNRWDALWTFVRVDGVEPTNNLAERTVRSGVLWRKISLFTQSERGREYVERMLTIKTTLRKQGGNLLEFLTESLRAARSGAPPPRIFAAPSPT